MALKISFKAEAQTDKNGEGVTHKLYIYDPVHGGYDIDPESWEFHTSETSAAYFRKALEEAAGKVNEFGEKMSGAGQSLLPATAAVTGFAALSVKAMDDVDAGLDVVIMNMIVLVLMMAVTVEALIEYAKTFGKAIIEKQWKTAATQAGAVALGVLLCFGVGADFYAALGVNFNVAWIGIALTGVFASRGANYVSDLVKKLQALGAEKVNNM